MVPANSRKVQLRMSEFHQSKKVFWGGWVLSGLVSALLLFSASGKVMQSAQVVEGFAKSGYPEASILPIGLLEVLFTVLFLVPRTNVLGAAFLTAYLGGAVATHVRGGDSFLMAILVAVFVWIASWLRTPALAKVFPIVSK
jgi:hypothetical protein